MGCRVERMDPWHGKSMTFLRAGQALIGTQEALPKALSDDDRRRLTDIANILHGALSWVRFCVLGSIPSWAVPRGAMEASQLLREVPPLASLAGSERDAKIAELLAAINGIILGQTQTTMATAQAAQFCAEVGDYLVKRWASERCDDEDD